MGEERELAGLRRTLWSLVWCESHGGSNQSEKGNDLESLHVDSYCAVVARQTLQIK
jgi:hypothetical protein